jgi:hypothetical protein
MATVALIQYALDQRFKLPIYDVDDERYEVLGAWIMTDVGYHLSGVVAALALIDDVADELAPAEELSGAGYAVAQGSDGLSFRAELARGAATYTVDEVREALEGYWRFLRCLPERPTIREYRPDLPEWHAALLWWEEDAGRRHPHRDWLFHAGHPCDRTDPARAQRGAGLLPAQPVSGGPSGAARILS